MKNSLRGRHYDKAKETTSADPRRRFSGVQTRAQRASAAPPVSLPEPARPLISIGSPADSSLLEPTYAYLSEYCFACLSPRVAERLNVAIYELLANALRYGSAAGEVRLELSMTSGGVRLSIGNHALAAQRERLELQLARVKKDPEAAFKAEMAHFSGGSGQSPMLGIVRVAHESKLNLALASDGQRVQLSTVCSD